MDKFDHSVRFYQNIVELQEKLRKSEEERMELEARFSVLMKSCREEEEAKVLTLRKQYDRFLKEDRQRRDRNERILQTLENIDNRASALAAKTDRMQLLKHHFEAHLSQLYPNWRRSVDSGCSVSTPKSWDRKTAYNFISPGRHSTTYTPSQEFATKPSFYSTSNKELGKPDISVHDSEGLPSIVDPKINSALKRGIIDDNIHSIGLDVMHTDNNTLAHDNLSDYIEKAARRLNYNLDSSKDLDKDSESEKHAHESKVGNSVDLEHDQATSKDLLNVSLSDDGILLDEVEIPDSKLSGNQLPEKRISNYESAATKEVISDCRKMQKTTLPHENISKYNKDLKSAKGPCDSIDLRQNIVDQNNIQLVEDINKNFFEDDKQDIQYNVNNQIHNVKNDTVTKEQIQSDDAKNDSFINNPSVIEDNMQQVLNKNQDQHIENQNQYFNIEKYSQLPDSELYEADRKEIHHQNSQLENDSNVQLERENYDQLFTEPQISDIQSQQLEQYEEINKEVYEQDNQLQQYQTLNSQDYEAQFTENMYQQYQDISDDKQYLAQLDDGQYQNISNEEQYQTELNNDQYFQYEEANNETQYQLPLSEDQYQESSEQYQAEINNDQYLQYQEANNENIYQQPLSDYQYQLQQEGNIEEQCLPQVSDDQYQQLYSEGKPQSVDEQFQQVDNGQYQLMDDGQYHYVGDQYADVSNQNIYQELGSEQPVYGSDQLNESEIHDQNMNQISNEQLQYEAVDGQYQGPVYDNEPQQDQMDEHYQNLIDDNGIDSQSEALNEENQYQLLTENKHREAVHQEVIGKDATNFEQHFDISAKYEQIDQQATQYVHYEVNNETNNIPKNVTEDISNLTLQEEVDSSKPEENAVNNIFKDGKYHERTAAYETTLEETVPKVTEEAKKQENKRIISEQNLQQYRNLLGVGDDTDPAGFSDMEEIEDQLAEVVGHNQSKQTEELPSVQATKVPETSVAESVMFGQVSDSTSDDSTTLHIPKKVVGNIDSKKEKLTSTCEKRLPSSTDIKNNTPAQSRPTPKAVATKLPSLTKMLESDTESLKLDTNPSADESDDFDFGSES